MHDRKTDTSSTIYTFTQGGYIQRHLKILRDAGIKIPMVVDILLKDGGEIPDIRITNETDIELPEQYSDFSEHNIRAIVVRQSSMLKRQFNVRTGELMTKEGIDPRFW